MGLCESKELEQVGQRDTFFQKQSQNRNSQFNEQTQQSYCKNRYETVMICDTLKTIAEESIIQKKESRQIQYQSTAPSPQTSEFGKLITQEMIIVLCNPKLSWNLQSHAIKTNGMQEVSVSQSQGLKYEEWEFQADHDGVLINQDRILLRHVLTDTFLTAEPSHDASNINLGTIKIKEITNSLLWQIEIEQDSLCENSLMKLKHIKSKLYLTRTNQNGTLDEHRLVVLSKFDPINSFWTINIK